MRILITGAAGMLGTEAWRIFTELGHEVVGTGTEANPVAGILALDITNFGDARSLLAQVQPEVVLHCAAYTHVDGAERDPDAAFRANALGAWCVASACEEIGAAIALVSTDFVFDGTKGSPYTEWDTPCPINQYGASKLAGENAARAACRRCWIVRTSWLYGVHGKNFPYTVLNLAKTKNELPIVADQRGTPTYTVDLVRAISELIQTPLYGLYHLSGSGETRWDLFAQAVLARANLASVRVLPMTSEEYALRFGSPTKRPPYSVLRNYAWELQGKTPLRPWADALDAFFQEARAAGKIDENRDENRNENRD